jgi:hypothetical protein
MSELFRNSVVVVAVSLSSLASVACTTQKAEVTEDFSDLAGIDQKADSFSYRLKLLGTLVDGDAKHAAYTKTPRFRGYDFHAAAGDQVDVWVRSTTGDALAWVLDGKFRVIAKNDDADATTTDAHLAVTLPDSGVADGRYYLVFRDYHAQSRPFTIAFHTTPAGGAGWEARVEAKTTELVSAYTPLSDLGVDEATLPAAAKARWSASVAVLELPTAYKLTVDGRVAYLVLATDGSGEGNVVVGDLIDSAGRWFGHGIGHTVWDGGSGLGWQLDDSDPTVCACDASHHAVCTWLDGATTPSTSITCP